MMMPTDEALPLISVIVPIYNVAPWLRTCLDSLRKQTLKQIEVICIDDGSTDESGKIAEEYKSDIWPIFRIIHTENRGLSAARNKGLDEASAEYIMFVDSDDWVDQDFCRIPYMAAIKNNADIVVFDRYLTHENGKRIRERKRNRPIGLINQETAIDTGWPAVWNKLYRRSLFNTLHFPEGKLYEELLTVHKLVYSAERIVGIDEVLYYYRKRKGGFTYSRANDSEWLDASIIRYQELKALGYPQIKAKTELLKVALKCCGRAKDIDSAVYKTAEKLMDKTDGIPCGFLFKEKEMMAFWLMNKRFYRLAYNLVRG